MSKNNPFDIYSGLDTKPAGESLSWEESILDSRSQVEGFSEREYNVMSFRWISWLVAFALIVLLGQLFRLQILQGEYFRSLAEGNRLREWLTLAPRGLIYDRFGKLLAQNTVSFRLVAVPVDLPKEGLDAEISEIAVLLGLDKEGLVNQISKVSKASFEPVILAQDVSKEKSLLFATRSDEFVGFSLEASPIRSYENADVFSHLIGYSGIISAKELEDFGSNYSSQDVVGKSGIEQQYEKYLNGEDGKRQIEVDAAGKVIKTLGVIEPVPGSELVLNVDQGLQVELYKNFQVFGKKGAAIAIDPSNGEVLALVSVPGFDTNLFAHGIKQQDYKSIIEDKNLPLFNRAISGTYPPGSTVKPMVALAALEEGVVTENTVIVDRGNLIIPNQFNPQISYNFYGWKREGLGPQTVRSAIAESSDIYFYTVGGGHPASPIQGLGADRLANYYRQFNLGKITGIDLFGEKAGLVADPSWKFNYFKSDKILSKWYLGDTYHIAIGQGDMLVTPLQVAVWTATIANNGVGMKPRILNRVVSRDGITIYKTEPEVLVTPKISKENVQIVQEGMRLAVTSGSGKQLDSLPIPCAGKTGTSQFDGSDPSRTHSWFTSYCPVNNPKIVITVLVEAGGEGHAVAEPIAKKTFEWWVKDRYNK